MSSKSLFASAIALFAVMASAPVSAHELTNKTLRPTFGASATDVWQVTCSGGGSDSNLFAQILDQTNDSNIVSLAVVAGTKALSTSDLIGGDTTYSPEIKVFAGDTTYTMLVTHTRTGGQAYSISYHCQNGTTHTATTVPSAPSQDQ